MPDFRQRSHAPELMDGDDVSQSDFAACIEDLAAVNTLTLARRPTLAFIGDAFRASPSGQTLTVLDVGFGAGDMLRRVYRLAMRRGYSVRLIGIDLNPRSEGVARRLTPADMAIEYRTGDLFAWPDTDPIDIVISSLVTHHMDDAEILRFLGWMEDHARAGWFINDLHRHKLPFHFFRLFARLMRWHRFVQHDGPLSIARAFRRDDWDRMLGAAHLAQHASVKCWFPFRYCVARSKG